VFVLRWKICGNLATRAWDVSAQQSRLRIVRSAIRGQREPGTVERGIFHQNESQRNSARS